MRIIEYLDNEDVIKGSDFVRPVDLMFIGQSDTLATTNAYSGKPTNHTRWIQVERAGMDYWIGRTVGELNTRLIALERPAQSSSALEFVRGDLPESVILPRTRNEHFNEVKGMTLDRGKYKGCVMLDILVSDRRYFYWAVAEGLIPYELTQFSDIYS